MRDRERAGLSNGRERGRKMREGDKNKRERERERERESERDRLNKIQERYIEGTKE